MKLNEEEKKAINYLENEYKKLEEEGNILFPLYKQQAKTVLNLIEKLQKENEEKDKYIKHSEEITTEMNEDINKLLIEIKEKDKQIDLMGEVIFKKFKAPLVIEYGIENKEQFIKHFENKVKEDKENE